MNKKIIIAIIIAAIIILAIVMIQKNKKENTIEESEKVEEVTNNTMIYGIVKNQTQNEINLTRNTKVFYDYTMKEKEQINPTQANMGIKEYEEVIVEKNDKVKIFDYETQKVETYEYIEEGDILLVTGNLNLLMQPESITVLKSKSHKNMIYNTLKNDRDTLKIIARVYSDSIIIEYCIIDNSHSDTGYLFPAFIQFDLPQNANITEDDIGKVVTTKYTTDSITIEDIENGNIFLKEVNVQ